MERLEVRDIKKGQEFYQCSVGRNTWLKATEDAQSVMGLDAPGGWEVSCETQHRHKLLKIRHQTGTKGPEIFNTPMFSCNPTEKIIITVVRSYEGMNCEIQHSLEIGDTEDASAPRIIQAIISAKRIARGRLAEKAKKAGLNIATSELPTEECSAVSEENGKTKTQ